MSSTKLTSYRLTEDTGFAPNPFFGILSLATGMPELRQSATVDDWIAGFTSGALCGHAPGTERLVFLMRVGEVVSYAEYHADPRFTRKIPHLNGGPEVERHGDNIYHPMRVSADAPELFEQLPNPHHWNVAQDRQDERSKRQDLRGRRVLLATEYAYFGRAPLAVPDFARPTLPRCNAPAGAATDDAELARAFIDLALGRASRPVVAPPHVWRNGDDSWRH